eukprot:2081052-Pleurochrysis_carterae.AAC.1
MEGAAQEGAAGPQGDHAVEAHSCWLGAAGDAQGQARREARQARYEGHRARGHRRAAACRALLRLEADGRGGPAGPARKAQAPGHDWLRALSTKPHGVCAAAADIASRGQRGRKRPRGRRLRHRRPQRSAPHDFPRPEAQ